MVSRNPSLGHGKLIPPDIFPDPISQPKVALRKEEDRVSVPTSQGKNTAGASSDDSDYGKFLKPMVFSGLHRPLVILCDVNLLRHPHVLSEPQPGVLAAFPCITILPNPRGE